MNILRYKQNGTIHLADTMKAALDATAQYARQGYRVHGYEAYCLLRSYVGTVVVYKSNHGRRLPRTIGDPITFGGVKIPQDQYRTQHQQALAHARAVARKWDGEQPREEEQREEEPPKDEPKDEQPKDENSHEFLAWVERVQEYQREQDVDPWGMRQAINGARLLKAGMPQDAVKDAFTIDFDDEARHVLGVRPFDLTMWGASIAREGESAHEAIIRTTMKAGVNACAVGGKGIGKTTGFERIAAQEDATIAVISCSDDGIRPDLFGTLTPGIREGYVLAEVADAMLKAEKGEKVFVLLDEADALTPSDAIKLNRALEQRKITHPFLGRTIEFGRNVQFFAAMNTTGNGADENFTGRDKQDAAFLDRFFRFRMGLDKKLQRELFEAEIA